MDGSATSAASCRQRLHSSGSLRQVFRTSSCVSFWARLQIASHEVEQLRLWSDRFGRTKLPCFQRGTGYSFGRDGVHHTQRCMVGRHRLGIERQLWLTTSGAALVCAGLARPVWLDFGVIPRFLRPRASTLVTRRIGAGLTPFVCFCLGVHGLATV